MTVLLHILSWLYGIGAGFRNLLYEAHILRSHRPALPAICVGNLAVGGTGKTPHVEYLVRLMHDHGIVTAVLSRGYKRRTVGYVEVSTDSTTSGVGDEALQLKRKFPELIVAVCENRLNGIKHLKNRHPDVQVVLLDDAFQHRRMQPGYAILLTPADRLYVEDKMLPLGRLRESPQGASRADMVVVSKCPDTIQPIEQRIIDNKLQLPPCKTLVFTKMRYLPLVPAFGGETGRALAPDAIRGKRILLLTGIAQPRYLADHLRETGADIRVLAFPDHHVFTQKDIKRIEQNAHEHQAALIVTTEKDAVRLGECALPEQLKNNIYIQPIDVQFVGNDQNSFNSNIIHYVKQSTSNR